ncbi:hypothetical protein, partial [Methylobacterium oxalidis]|uniref:hypothetical protein n=1 Tax=Methylobacterium oxalidis TaxID=944322 RepID=UPI001EDD777F
PVEHPAGRHGAQGVPQGARAAPGTAKRPRPLKRAKFQRRVAMLKGGLLWLIGIPLPIILLIYFFTNWLH